MQKFKKNPIKNSHLDRKAVYQLHEVKRLRHVPPTQKVKRKLIIDKHKTVKVLMHLTSITRYN